MRGNQKKISTEGVMQNNNVRSLLKKMGFIRKQFVNVEVSCKCRDISKGKGKVHPCTGTEALYRPYGL